MLACTSSTCDHSTGVPRLWSVWLDDQEVQRCQPQAGRELRERNLFTRAGAVGIVVQDPIVTVVEDVIRRISPL